MTAHCRGQRSATGGVFKDAAKKSKNSLNLSTYVWFIMETLDYIDSLLNAASVGLYYDIINGRRSCPSTEIAD